MIETKDFTIDTKKGPVKYMVTQFPARYGLRLKTELIKLLAPSLFSLAGNLDAKVESSNISLIIESLCTRLDEGAIESLVLRLLSSTRREGKEVDKVFDDVYAGNYGELFKALKFVIEVNYGSFFQELGISNLAELPAVKQGKDKKAASVN